MPNDTPVNCQRCSCPFSVHGENFGACQLCGTWGCPAYRTSEPVNDTPDMPICCGTFKPVNNTDTLHGITHLRGPIELRHGEDCIGCQALAFRVKFRRLEAENRALHLKLDEMQKVKNAVQSALENVYALVEGESPSLMEDDHNFEKAYEAIQLANDFDASNPPADQPKEKV